MERRTGKKLGVFDILIANMMRPQTHAFYAYLGGRLVDT